jgi:hypothetical protein
MTAPDCCGVRQQWSREDASHCCIEPRTSSARTCACRAKEHSLAGCSSAWVSCGASSWRTPRPGACIRHYGSAVIALGGPPGDRLCAGPGSRAARLGEAAEPVSEPVGPVGDVDAGGHAPIAQLV